MAIRETSFVSVLVWWGHRESQWAHQIVMTGTWELIWRAVKISRVKTITAWTGTHHAQHLPERLAFLFVTTNQIWPSYISTQPLPFQLCTILPLTRFTQNLWPRLASVLRYRCHVLCGVNNTFLIEHNIILNSKLWKIVNFMVSWAEMHNNCNSAIKHSTNVVKNWIIISPPVKSSSQAPALP